MTELSRRRLGVWRRRAGVVVRSDDGERTQNGHIRNDTHDVSRRISTAFNSSICRRKCVASDRACKPLPALHFYGKEGVDGSSPSEGLREVPANGDFSRLIFNRLSRAGTRGHALTLARRSHANLGTGLIKRF